MHHEVLADARPVLADIRKRGAKAGLAINPDAPVEALIPYLPLIDLALCMTVFPGFGGQPFLPESPDRIARLRRLIDAHNPRCDLEVDGGIDAKTAPIALAAGANVFVVGTGIYRHPAGVAAAVRELRKLCAGQFLVAPAAEKAARRARSGLARSGHNTTAPVCASKIAEHFTSGCPVSHRAP